MKLQETRKKAGLSQNQLAEKAGVNLRTLQHYEQKTKNFDNAKIDTILKVCLALNCKIQDIIEDESYLQLLDTYENIFRSE